MSAQPDYPRPRNSPQPRWPTVRRRLIGGVIALVLLAIVAFGTWTWITLHFTYSSGDRVGYIQKMSKKGWVCKTWEGELAMLNQPGVPPQIFKFTVSDENVAQSILKFAGQRVRLTYKQHRGVPTSCFGETEYFVTSASALGP
jgi:hypothetical protein